MYILVHNGHWAKWVWLREIKLKTYICDTPKFFFAIFSFQGGGGRISLIHISLLSLRPLNFNPTSHAQRQKMFPVPEKKLKQYCSHDVQIVIIAKCGFTSPPSYVSL